MKRIQNDRLGSSDPQSYSLENNPSDINNFFALELPVVPQANFAIGSATAQQETIGNPALRVSLGGNDLLLAQLEQNILKGTEGNDRLIGRLRADLIKGLPGNDLLLGGLGSDVLQGAAGRDLLFGEVGRDSLIGGSGIDFLSGGLGDDLLNGGGGCDIFALRQRRSTDTIQDFDTNGDLLFIPGSVSFDDLNIRQQGGNTVVSIASTRKPIAILENVQASSISSTDFIGDRINRTLLDFVNREQAGAILDAIQAEASGRLKNLLNVKLG